jgi:hypothetical protein
MAISYSLDIATSVPAAEVARALHEVGGAARVLDDSVAAKAILDEGTTTRFGTWVRVVEATPRPWHPVITDLGFTPTVSVVFRLDKESKIADQQDDMVRVTSGVLSRIPGDAVLHQELETIWLLRRDNEVTVSEQDDLWPTARLAILGHSARRATHTFAQ